MSESLLIKSYTSRTAERIQTWLGGETEGSWLRAYRDQIFQICDELIKNAIKSNYKFLLIWLSTFRRILARHPEFQNDELNSWLGAVFFSGEDHLVERHLDLLENRPEINTQVRHLLDLENSYIRSRPAPDRDGPDDFSRLGEAEPRLRPLLDIKEMAQALNIYVHFHIEKSIDQLLITISNDSPILHEDIKRIHHVRGVFKTYRDQGRPEEFFIENLDTSGGGHGLGYAIMDSILHEMDLDPDHSLYLISATRTMVLLVLPLEPQQRADRSD